MHSDRDILGRIDSLPAPRHLFVLPTWVEPSELDRIIEAGYLTCDHLQRDEKGIIQVVMGMELTRKGHQLIRPGINWPNLALKGSLAGASFTAMSFLILYLG